MIGKSHSVEQALCYNRATGNNALEFDRSELEMMIQASYQTINRKLQQSDYLRFTQIDYLIDCLGVGDCINSLYQRIMHYSVKYEDY